MTLWRKAHVEVKTQSDDWIPRGIIEVTCLQVVNITANATDIWLWHVEALRTKLFSLSFRCCTAINSERKTTTKKKNMEEIFAIRQGATRFAQHCVCVHIVGTRRAGLRKKTGSATSFYPTSTVVTWLLKNETLQSNSSIHTSSGYTTPLGPHVASPNQRFT